MLQKPDLPDDSLIDGLRREYGLRVSRIEFLPIGADANAAVYRTGTDVGTPYFVKLRGGAFDDLPSSSSHHLETQGIPHLSAPVETQDGRLWTRLDRFVVILYPFIEVQDGLDIHLTDRQWVELGRVLEAVHTARQPDEILARLPRETFSPIWFERSRAYQERFEIE